MALFHNGEVVPPFISGHFQYIVKASRLQRNERDILWLVEIVTSISKAANKFLSLNITATLKRRIVKVEP